MHSFSSIVEVVRTLCFSQNQSKGENRRRGKGRRNFKCRGVETIYIEDHTYSVITIGRMDMKHIIFKPLGTPSKKDINRIMKTKVRARRLVRS